MPKYTKKICFLKYNINYRKIQLLFEKRLEDYVTLCIIKKNYEKMSKKKIFNKKSEK